MTKKTIFRIWFKLIREDLDKIYEFIGSVGYLVIWMIITISIVFIVYPIIRKAPITISVTLVFYEYDALALMFAILGFVCIWFCIRLVEAYNTVKKNHG